MIRRPLMFAAAGFVSAVLISYYAGIPAGSVTAGAAASAAFLMRGRKNASEKRKLIARLLLISYCAGLFCFCFSTYSFKAAAEDIEAVAGINVSVEGTVKTCEQKTGSDGEAYLSFALKSSRGMITVRHYDEISLIPGMRVNVCGEIEKPSPGRNPGCFDYELYLKSLGITAVMTADSVTVTDKNDRSLRGRIFIVRENFMDRLGRHTDRGAAAMIRAIMFGDKGELEEETLQVFQKNGTAHILAVSGLHIGIIYGLILKIWMWRKDWKFFVFVAMFFGFYTVMADFSPSVVRAVCMVLLHVFAGMSGRRYDLNNAAFLVVLGILIHNPYMLFNPGFQMSFLAVLTMTLVMPFVRNIYSGAFLASLAVQIGLGPFIVYSFNYMSIIAVFINVPVIALAGVIVPLGLAAMVFQFTFLFEYAAAGTELLCRILVRLNEAVEISGVTTFQVPSPPLWIMAFYYLVLLFFAAEEGRIAIMRAAHRGRYIMRTVVLLLALSLAFAAFAGDGFEKSNLTFADVGQGDCICVRTDGGILQKPRCYLIDGGGNVNYNVGHRTLRPYLLKNGISHVDGAFVTHRHTDHYKGICELAADGMIDRLYLYEGNRLKKSEIAKETGMPEEAVEYLHGGQSIRLGRKGSDGNEVTLEILWPQQKTDAEYEKLLADEENENAMSLVFRLVYSGGSGSNRSETRVLITGDMGEDGEAQLIRETATGGGVDADILKAGHHGSRTSTSEEFLDAVSPEIAVIQVGRNNYGHPAPETLERIAAQGVPVYRNDECGALGFEIEKGTVKKMMRMIE